MVYLLSMLIHMLHRINLSCIVNVAILMEVQLGLLGSCLRGLRGFRRFNCRLGLLVVVGVEGCSCLH